MLSKNVAASVAALLFVVGCVTAPYTGRGQLMLVFESNEIESGGRGLRHIMRDSVWEHKGLRIGEGYKG